MALSNRDRIGRMLETMSPPLDAFLQRTVATELPQGRDWTVLVSTKDSRNGRAAVSLSRTDPQVQLRMLTENIPHQLKPGWFPFDGVLSNVHKSYASELRDIRNDWAHGNPFTDDDTYRALDTAERLMTAVGAPEAATTIAAMRQDLRRVTAGKDDRRVLRAAAANPESDGLRPWREVLRPHDDVATGNFHAAEFAADLYKVATGDTTLGADYTDPVAFFDRTYLTEGLRDLIGRAVRRLGGDQNASPVINLQTNFGGGKTHSMLSLWHLAAGRPLGDFNQEIQETLSPAGYAELPSGVRRVALVGNHLAPTGNPATGVRTIWGELAWQLGGPDAYALVADADRAGTAPGQALHELLARYAPAVILVDEWVAYARQLYGRDDLPAGTFDTQFGFAQSLTEAVRATPGVLLAISIPASDDSDEGVSPGSAEEVGGTHGLEALRRLQNIVRRVAEPWRPASSGEAYHIVRRRLFVEPDPEALAAIGATAKAFVGLYRSHGADFPRETRENEYEQRIRQTYPIHPELFDRLYQDWSTLERFQRTRGVLRLMNNVIHALWVGNDASPLIMPGSIPMSVSSVNSELTQYLQDSWKAIIDADVDGDDSEPARIDTAAPVYGQRSVTRRLARTVFFGAAPTIGTAHKGIETQRVFLGTAMPGDVVGNFHSALTQLADRATYFYSAQGKYWYDTQANITRRAKDQAEALHEQDVWLAIRERLDRQSRTRGPFPKVVVCPADSAEIADGEDVALVIVPPRVTHKKATQSPALEFARDATEHRGGAHRVNRNQVVFLAADTDRMADLDAAVRQYLGWQDVLAHEAELDLNATQKQQAVEQVARHDRTVEDRLALTYQWLLVPTAVAGEPFDVKATRLDGSGQALPERAARKLGNEDEFATKLGPAKIRFLLGGPIAAVWQSGNVAVGDLWRLFCEHPYMPRVRDRATFTDALREQQFTWTVDGFAFADGVDESGRYLGLVLPPDLPASVSDSTLLVRPDVAQAQRDRERPVAPTDVPEHHDHGEGDRVAAPPPVEAPAPAVNTRFFGTKQLTAATFGADINKLYTEVVAHLGPDVRITIDVEASNDAGFDERTVRTVRENATTLKFEQLGFE